MQFTYSMYVTAQNGVSYYCTDVSLCFVYPADQHDHEGEVPLIVDFPTYPGVWRVCGFSVHSCICNTVVNTDLQELYDSCVLLGHYTRTENYCSIVYSYVYMCHVVAHMHSLNKLEHMAIITVEVTADRDLSPQSPCVLWLVTLKTSKEHHSRSYLGLEPGGARISAVSLTVLAALTYIGWNVLALPGARGPVSWWPYFSPCRLTCVVIISLPVWPWLSWSLAQERASRRYLLAEFCIWAQRESLPTTCGRFQRHSNCLHLGSADQMCQLIEGKLRSDQDREPNNIQFVIKECSLMDVTLALIDEDAQFFCDISTDKAWWWGKGGSPGGECCLEGCAQSGSDWTCPRPENCCKSPSRVGKE